MELEDVYRKDLNLLVALKVLMEEGSVGRAAARLNLSQSAMIPIPPSKHELCSYFEPLDLRWNSSQ